MPQSLASIHLHLVFSTKDRAPLIADRDEQDLHNYLGVILRASGCPPHGIGGTANHVHFLFDLGREITVAALVRELKSNSSKWMKERSELFAWQRGYGVFSVSPDRLGTVRSYVANQAEHHQSLSFEDEYQQILREHGIQVDETYLWD